MNIQINLPPLPDVPFSICLNEVITLYATDYDTKSVQEALKDAHAEIDSLRSQLQALRKQEPVSADTEKTYPVIAGGRIMEMTAEQRDSWAWRQLSADEKLNVLRNCIAAPVQKPLTQEQVQQESESRGYRFALHVVFMSGIRWAEGKHGIK